MTAWRVFSWFSSVPLGLWRIAPSVKALSHSSPTSNCMSGTILSVLVLWLSLDTLTQIYSFPSTVRSMADQNVHLKSQLAQLLNASAMYSVQSGSNSDTVSATPVNVGNKFHKILKYLRFVYFTKNCVGKTKIYGWNPYRLLAEMPRK